MVGRRAGEGVPPTPPLWIPAFAGMTSLGAGVASREAIPDRSPGHAFIAIAHAGYRRNTKV